LSVLHNYFDGLNKIIFRFVAKLLAIYIYIHIYIYI